MKRIVLVLVACWSTFGISVSKADCPHCGNTGACYKEVVSYRCVKVPDVKPVKKVFYECKLVPFCQPALPGFLCDDCCTECDCPRFKRVLVKREVEVGETCGTKCIVEAFTERVRIPCCHCCEQHDSDPQCESPSGCVRPVPPPTAYKY